MCLDITSYLLGKKSGGGGKKPELQEKSITITQNGETIVTPDEGKDGLSKVNITTNVSGGGGLDWSAIGYSSTPQALVNKYNYSKEIQDNWVPNQNLNNKFQNKADLVYMPLVDTSIATQMNYMFSSCSTLESIPLLDTSNVTTMMSMFQNCYRLEIIPLLDTSNVTKMNAIFSSCSKLQYIPLLNTSNVTNMSNMFSSCYMLETVPLLNTSNVTSMISMFTSCNKLSNESLNNILQMCINAVKMSSNKTLKSIGLTSAQATTCQGLSNYQAFLDAGWTTGY